MSTIDSSPGGCLSSKILQGESSQGSGGSSGKATKMAANATFGSHIEYSIKSSGSVFIKENTGNIKDFYKISSCIGRGKSIHLFMFVGAYGEVRKCLHKETKALRAVKIINKKYLAENEKERLLSEINILKQLDHPNILKLYEFFQDAKRYFLVTE
jgi:calcium-dependent protein kinase